ncbi:MAG: DUF2961 domain-containing protein [Planctomycetes bacterium]|nr:DUF2961 domain-containing protein [Planctomycetota bacterium]
MDRIVERFGWLAWVILFVSNPDANAWTAQEEKTVEQGSAAPGETAPVETQDNLLTLSDLLAQYTDLADLARFEKGTVCRQFSSYDRTGWKANRDWEHYIRSTEAEGNVAAEIEGPGCIVQIWSANPSGRLRFYLDGADEPALDLDMAAWFDDQVFPFVDPLVYRVSGANAYFPVPFQHSCKITVTENDPLYYHIVYKTFPKETPVETYSAAGLEKARDKIATAVALLHNPGPHLVEAFYPEAKEIHPLNLEVPSGKTAEIFSRGGSGQVALIELKGSTTERHYLRKNVLKIYWDKASDPAVHCPLGDFFGTPFGENLYQALPMGMTKSGGYCLFPMPFENGMRIEIANQGDLPLEVTGRVVLSPLPEHEKGGLMRFHAGWRRENPCRDFDYGVLKAQGPGRFVGCALFIDNPKNSWWGEGDEKIWVDDEDFPSFFGTGTEDYFGDAWGHRRHIKPFQGCTLIQNPYHGNKTCAYRFHISDSIPFDRSFRMIFENYAENVDYSSVAWWYEASPEQGDFFPDLPVGARLPGKPKAIGAFEAEHLRITTRRSKLLTVDDESLPEELSAGRGVLMKGQGPYTMTLQAPKNGNYIVRLLFASQMNHPAVELTAPEGVSLLPTPIPGGKAGTMQPVEAGWVKMKQGENRIDLLFSKMEDEDSGALLDAVYLEPLERKQGAMEAEELKIRMISGGLATVEDFTLPWSGGAQVRFVAGQKQSRLDLELPVSVEGFFTLHDACSRTAGYGSFIVSLDHKPLGEIDPKQLEGNDIGLFSLHAGFLEQGTRLLSVFTDTAVGLDYFKLDWSLGDEHVFEGEELEIMEQSGETQVALNLDPRFFSLGGQLVLNGQKEGDFIETEVPARLPGEYKLKVFYSKSWDHGIVRVTLNGERKGLDFDGYHPGLQPSGAVDYGTVKLDSGVHRLRFEIVGKNEDAFGYQMGVDAIMLVPW